MEALSLTELARVHLLLAHDAPAGRSASTVYGGHQHALRQTLIALVSGRRLDEHENPGEATVQVIRGTVELAAGDTAVRGSAGDLIEVPDRRHSLAALEDSVVLLTVSKRLS